MPIRFLKPGLNDSKRYNRCSWAAQSLYTRLLMNVDDHARYEADPEMLAAKLFPFGMPSGSKVRVESVASWLHELEIADMLAIYEAGGRRYLVITRWTERIRAMKSRFPTPPAHVLTALAGKCCQVTANAASPTSTSTSTSTATQKNEHGVDARASTAQFAALREQIGNLEAAGERVESRKKRRTLAALQKKQAAGDFNPLEPEETPK